MTPNFLQKFILQRGIQGWACSGVGGKWWVNLKCHSSAVEVWLSLGSLLRATVLGSLQASPEAPASSMAPRNKHGLWPSSSSLPHLCSSWFCRSPLRVSLPFSQAAVLLPMFEDTGKVFFQIPGDIPGRRVCCGLSPELCSNSEWLVCSFNFQLCQRKIFLDTWSLSVRALTRHVKVARKSVMIILSFYFF